MVEDFFALESAVGYFLHDFRVFHTAEIIKCPLEFEFYKRQKHGNIQLCTLKPRLSLLEFLICDRRRKDEKKDENDFQGGEHFSSMKNVKLHSYLYAFRVTRY